MDSSADWLVQCGNKAMNKCNKMQNVDGFGGLMEFTSNAKNLNVCQSSYNKRV